MSLIASIEEMAENLNRVFQAWGRGEAALADSLPGQLQGRPSPDDAREIARLRAYILDNAAGLPYPVIAIGQGTLLTHKTNRTCVRSKIGPPFSQYRKDVQGQEAHPPRHLARYETAGRMGASLRPTMGIDLKKTGTWRILPFRLSDIQTY
jgi:hypothetical protein